MTTPRWQDTPEWRKAIDKRGFYPIDVENAAGVAVAAYRRQLRTQVDALPTPTQAVLNFKAAVLGLLGGDE